MICLNHLMFKIGKILPSEGFKKNLEISRFGKNNHRKIMVHFILKKVSFLFMNLGLTNFLTRICYARFSAWFN